jgi:AcrR family transcriptional regulator
MSKGRPDTQARILAAGKAEFLKKGFHGASLRTIAKRAGVTTGAIYGYYTGKMAFFDSFVAESAVALREKFAAVQEALLARPVQDRRADTGPSAPAAMRELHDLIYRNADAFKLILHSSAGTPYEGFVDSLVEIETERAARYTESRQTEGGPIRSIPQAFSRALINACFGAAFETIRLGLQKAEADAYSACLARFFEAGWDAVLARYTD